MRKGCASIGINTLLKNAFAAPMTVNEPAITRASSLESFGKRVRVDIIKINSTTNAKLPGFLILLYKFCIGDMICL